MDSQNEEHEIFTAIAQFLVDSLAYNAILSWDKVSLHIKLKEASMSLVLEYSHKDDVINIEGVPEAEQQYPITLTVNDLKEYTEKHNYAPWNSFTFELTPEYAFDIKLLWDDALANKGSF